MATLNFPPVLFNDHLKRRDYASLEQSVDQKSIDLLLLYVLILLRIGRLLTSAERLSGSVTSVASPADLATALNRYGVYLRRNGLMR
jgi:hypothetical protein